MADRIFLMMSSVLIRAMRRRGLLQAGQIVSGHLRGLGHEAATPVNTPGGLLYRLRPARRGLSEGEPITRDMLSPLLLAAGDSLVDPRVCSTSPARPWTKRACPTTTRCARVLIGQRNAFEILSAGRIVMGNRDDGNPDGRRRPLRSAAAWAWPGQGFSGESRLRDEGAARIRRVGSCFAGGSRDW